MNLIVDGMNIAFRCHHVYDVKQGLSTSSGLPTGIVYGFLKSLLKWQKQFSGRNIVVTWDAPDGKKGRQALYPEYKANRTSTFESVPEELVEGLEEVTGADVFSFQIEVLTKFLTSLGIDQAIASGEEADDVIATLVRKRYPDDSNVILSSDRDLLQLVTWKTVLQTPEGKVYDPDRVKDTYGVSPSKLVEFRALDGDSSDNLPGLPRFRKKVIAKLINDHGSLDSIYTSSVDEGLTKKEAEKLKDFRDQAFLNRRIMELKDLDVYQFTPGSRSEREIEGLLDLLEFGSLKSDLLDANKNQGFLRFFDEPLLHSTD